MSAPVKRAKLELEEVSPTHSCESQKSLESSGSSASNEGTPKRKFNFWRNKKTEEETSAMLPSSEMDKDFQSLTVGRKQTKIQFRVSHTSTRQTKHGIRLGVCSYDLTGKAELFGFRQAADKFYSLLKVGEAYEISDFQVKQAPAAGNPQIELYESTELIITPDSNIPMLDFSFADINAITEMYQDPPAEVRADFLGIAVRVSPLGTTVKGDSMQTIDLTDKTFGNIPLKLWGKTAEVIEVKEFDVLAVRQAAVRKFKEEIQLNFEYQTGVLVNPNQLEAEELRKWFESAKEDAMETDHEMMEED